MRSLNVIEEKQAEHKPLFQRKYILLHDDGTAQLNLFIVSEIEKNVFSEKRDEIFGCWGEGVFEIYCFLDSENSRFSTAIRYEIFKAHIKNSLIAMMRGERKFVKSVLDFPVREIFYSEGKNIYREHKNFTLRDYIWDGNQFSSYDRGFDYSKLGRKIECSDGNGS